MHVDNFIVWEYFSGNIRWSHVTSTGSSNDQWSKGCFLRHLWSKNPLDMWFYPTRLTTCLSKMKKRICSILPLRISSLWSSQNPPPTFLFHLFNIFHVRITRGYTLYKYISHRSFKLASNFGVFFLCFLHFLWPYNFPNDWIVRK